MLFELIAGEKANSVALPECEQTNAIVLALKDPLRSGKAVLSQRSGHRNNPFRKSHPISRLSPMCSEVSRPSTVHSGLVGGQVGIYQVNFRAPALPDRSARM